MKHVWIVLLAALLVLTAVGCKKKAEVVVDLPADGNKAGGWSVADDPTVTEARKAIFDKGMVVSSNCETSMRGWKKRLPSGLFIPLCLDQYIEVDRVVGRLPPNHGSINERLAD